MAQRSLDLIEAMHRGVGYKLFTQGLIASRSEMKRVYRLLKEGSRAGSIIPWGMDC